MKCFSRKPFAVSDNKSPLPLPVAYLMLVGVVFFWSTGLVLVKGVHETIPPVGLTFWRWMIGAMCLAPLVIPRLKYDLPVMLKNWKFYVSMGFFMIGASALTAISLNFTTATNASIVNATQPTMTALVAWVFFHEKLSPLQFTGIIAAVIGILIMVSKADLQLLLNLGFNPGDMIMVLAVLGYAIYANRLRWLPKEISFVGGLFTIFLFGSLVQLPLYIYESINYKTVPLTFEIAGTLFLLAFFTSVIPMFMWNKAVPIVGVNRSAIFVNLMPVFSTIMAIIFLGEQLFLYHVTGAVIVCAGIFLVVKGHRSA
jgi:drug/metabolite transporter (DMT)-like permease